MGDVEASPERILLNITTQAASQQSVQINGDDEAYFSGLVAKVPYMVPILAAKLMPMTAHGFVAMSL